MANILHNNARKLWLDADLDMLVATIKIDLIDAADDTIIAADDYYDDIAAAAIEETATLGTKTTGVVATGVFDSADGTWSAAAGDPCEEVEMWCDTGGAASTDPLIANYDTFASGMPVTLNGGDVNYTVNASGWFAI
jgi:hypothetical protein